jgi:hypothetical protein
LVIRSFCHPPNLHPTKPPPELITFACRLLSISAISASCERLFSVFGNILTKLRTEVSTENLTNLSEVKLHVRNEYPRPDKKKRIKRQLGQPQIQINVLPPFHLWFTAHAAAIAGAHFETL